MKLATRLILVGTMALSVACGATPEPVTAASQARASGLVIALHVDNDAKGLRESLAEALTTAGFTVVAPRADNNDVDIVANVQVTTSDTRKVGILTLKGVDDVHVRLVLASPDGGHLGVVEDQLSGNLTEADLAPMARELVDSRATTRAQRGERLAMQAAQKKREEDAEQRRIEVALEARKAEQVRLAKLEEEAWSASRDECATASRSTSCDALAKFAWTDSKSVHAPEAEALVAKSRVRDARAEGRRSVGRGRAAQVCHAAGRACVRGRDSLRDGQSGREAHRRGIQAAQSRGADLREASS